MNIVEEKGAAMRLLWSKEEGIYREGKNKIDHSKGACHRYRYIGV